MEIKQVDPNDISVSDFNERVETDMGGGVQENGSLQASVDKLGVIQPPLVRIRNGDGSTHYEVVVGQRRTLAAQSSKDRGLLDSIPVVVVDWDDGDALEASISENVDSFRESVGKKDRAVAIQRLKELKGWSNADVARELGVGKTTVASWLEPLREEWEGTSISPTYDRNESTGPGSIQQSEAQSDPNLSMVQNVRKMTGGGEEGERVLKVVEQEGLAERDVRQASEIATRRNISAEEAVKQVAEEKKATRTGDIKVNTRVTFTGDYAKAIQNAAVDRATSDEDIVRMAVQSWLDREGYL